METDPFRIRDHVAAFDAIVEDIVNRSALARASLEMIGDIAYGDGPDETVDVFFPPGPRVGLPVHIFVHGGYWRMFSKRDYSCIAVPVTQAGAIAVIVDYALMPKVRMDVLVDQVHRAALWVTDHIADHGGDPRRLSVSGHSAGAHLASFLFQQSDRQTAIKAALLLGGLYDLALLQHSFLRSEIGLTDDEVARFTPLGQRHDAHCRVTLAVGEDETPPFHLQTRQFAEHLERQALEVSTTTIAGENHMSSVRDLGVPGTATSELLVRMLKSL